MKKTLIIAACMLTINAVKAQKVKESEVPASVKEAFVKKYPGASAKWEKEKDGYEAEFDWNKAESSATFDADGTFRELEQEIKLADLPAGVKEYCTKTYPGCKITEASKITDAAGNVTFEAEMKKGKERFDLIFNKAGQFVRKSDVPADRED